MMDKVLFILGPTAVGKTDISVKLAKEFNGEIISCDSVQIFKGFDIGSAKIKKEEMKGISHHLIDIVEPNENFTAFDMTEAIKEKIKEITNRHHLPIVVGGTSLYVKSLILNYNYGGVGIDEAYRKMLQEILEKEGVEKLSEMLEKEDKDAFLKIDRKNPLRLIRALEIAHLKGEKKTAEKIIEPLVFALVMDRQKLYERIDRRVDIMLKDGLIEEVKVLLRNRVRKDSQSIHAIGYKEVVAYLDDEISYDRMAELIKQHSRNYAKRQLTFLRGMEDVNYVNVENSDDLNLMKEKIKGWLNG